LDQKIDNGLLRLEKKIDDGLLRLDQKIDNGLVDVRKEIAEVRKENMSHFRWLVGIIVLFTSSPLIIESMKLLIKSMSIH
ncbi:hypothetical protein ACTMJF_24050, partial [Escherichia coli]|uniref:hypothetical protein n=1 Tax=Escherichia coli TaxID=562 RepID=UPI003F88B91E